MFCRPAVVNVKFLHYKNSTGSGQRQGHVQEEMLGGTGASI